MKLELTAAPKPEDIEAISDGLSVFNRRFVGAQRRNPLAVFITDDSGKNQGGLTGYTLGLWLNIEMLWVSDSVRHSGMGTRLIQIAEEEAIKRGCQFSQVDTFSFQARPFYEKQGYQLQMALKNYLDTHHRYYLTKSLSISQSKSVE